MSGYTEESEGLGAHIIPLPAEGERVWLDELTANMLVDLAHEQGKILARATKENWPGARAVAFGYDSEQGKPFMVLMDFATVVSE